MPFVAHSYETLLRSITIHPGFTALAGLILAIGINANTIIFTFVCAISIGLLPHSDCSRLVMLLKLNHGRRSGQPGFRLRQKILPL
jgi:hypothetical protein